jgi:hypothetical protein
MLVFVGVLLLGATILVACRGGGGGGTTVPTLTTYSVGGTVSGLSGALVLQNNGANDLTLAANGPFAFPIALSSGTSYAVTIRSQPGTPSLTQNCTVSGGTGTIASTNVTSVAILCTTTMINGLAVPPDPGAANDLTLAGIDSDTNGIRDDIDILIATRYGANATATKAARASARAHQRVLTTPPGQPDAARIALQELGDAGVCAGREFRAAGLDSGDQFRELYLRVFNTRERLDHDRRIGAAAGLFERSVLAAVCQ